METKTGRSDGGGSDVQGSSGSPNRSTIEYWVQWNRIVGSKSMVLWSVLI